jgi:uncharacterized lipoprotein YmbA
MTAGSPPRRHVVGALLLLPCFGACSATPAPTLCVLAPRPAPPLNRPAATIAVKPVEIPKYLDRTQIVRRTGPYELEALEFDRWGEGLSEMVIRVLIENLCQRLPSSQVRAAAVPFTLPSPELTIEVNVDKFDADAEGAVTLVAQWVVYRGRDDQLRSEEIRIATTSRDPAGQVAGMGDALGQLSSQIAARLAT